MAGILRFKNTEGQWVDVPSIVGKTGVSIVRVTRIGRAGDIEEGFIDTYRIDFSDNTSSEFTVTNGARGEKGEKGDQPEINIGTVTTLNAGEDATVDVRLDEESGKQYLDFGIPKGRSTVTFIEWGDED